MWFDGSEEMLGGGVPMIPYYQPIIESHLLDDASMTMVNTGYIGATSGQVTVHVEVEWVEYSPVVLRFALIEHGLVSDDTYNYVCRDFLPEETLTITSPGQTFDITRNFTVSSPWIAQNMDIVTFVQYNTTKQVLQSSMGFHYPTGNVTVTLTPSGTPIVIPPSGGQFSFNVLVLNNETTSWTFDAWTNVTLPNGSPYGPLLGPLVLTLGAGASLDRNRTQAVPGNAPSGTYSYNARVGNYPDDIWDSDSFAFQKSAVGDGGTWIGDWANAGEPLSSDRTVAPADFKLGQNYPNPFNPRTAISFVLPSAANVRLGVYGVDGRLVATVVEGWRETGTHEVIFDGSGLASGIYVYRLEAGPYAANGKMVLMK